MSVIALIGSYVKIKKKKKDRWQVFLETVYFLLIRPVTGSKQKSENVIFQLWKMTLNPCPRFLQRYKKTSHHADRGSVASWSRSSTPCRSLAEDCSTNELAREPGPSPTPDNLCDIWTLGVCCSSRHKRQETVVEKVCKDMTAQQQQETWWRGLQSLEWASFSFFFLQPYFKWSHDWNISSKRAHRHISQVMIKSLLSTNAEGSNCEPLENAGYSTLILDEEFLFFFVFLSPGETIDCSDSQHVAPRHLSCINVGNMLQLKSKRNRCTGIFLLQKLLHPLHRKTTDLINDSFKFITIVFDFILTFPKTAYSHLYCNTSVTSEFAQQSKISELKIFHSTFLLFLKKVISHMQKSPVSKQPFIS